MSRPGNGVRILAACLLLTACGKVIDDEPVSDLNMEEFMVHVMDPAAKQFWAAWGEIHTLDGMVDISAKTEAEWKKVEDGAATVIVAAGVLQRPEYTREPAGKWRGYAKAVADLAKTGMEKAEAQDLTAMQTLGEELDKRCEACHEAFIPKD